MSKKDMGLESHSWLWEHASEKRTLVCYGKLLPRELLRGGWAWPHKDQCHRGCIAHSCV